MADLKQLEDRNRIDDALFLRDRMEDLFQRYFLTNNSP